MEYASNAKGNLGVTLGAIGTGLGALGGLGGLLGGMANNAMAYNNCGCGCQPTCSENTYVTRYEQTLVQENSAKDAEIALLKADKYTDQKIVETYTVLDGKISALAAQVQANKDAQTAVNMQQTAYNAANTAAITCIQGQITQLMSLTKLGIPNDSLCPGYGTAVVTPPAAAAA